ncbi:MAG: hypothetical protein HKO05_04795 [Erythrobacter sp.]|nr:hypothetical protein [Erythrobacter sp.]
MAAGRLSILALSAVLLAGCSEPAAQETADDFANRIGASGATVAVVQGDASASGAAGAQVPQGTDATQLQLVGNIDGVDLGTRTGGCTFQEVGREVLVTAGNAENGKGAIRVGGALVTLDAAGGIGAIRSGTTFSAQGVSISVAPTAGNQAKREANMVVTDAAGVTQSYSGDWICG